MFNNKAGIACAVLLGAIAVLSGCIDQNTPSPRVNSNTSSPQENTQPSTNTESTLSPSNEEHGHKPGAHGGIMVSLGRDSYHAEAVFEKGGVLRLYMLGKDESRVIDVESQTLRGFAKADGDTEAVSISLEPEPQEGDSEGRTSQFVAKLPEDLSGRNIEITVPSLTISGERFRLGFSSRIAEHESGMPGKVADKEEHNLYLTPGGKYTASDIAANGNVTAAVKFKGRKSSHDMSPKKGDKICPITKTKANADFAWIVGGKTYEFCCPPCVDEFVKTAKSTPDVIQEPDTYIKQ